MGYEPECRVLGLGVLPPRVPRLRDCCSAEQHGADFARALMMKSATLDV